MKKPINRTLPFKFEPYAKVVWLNYPDDTEDPNCLEFCGTHWEDLLFNFFINNEEIHDFVIEVDTNMGMTNRAIEIHFRYYTSDEMIEHICNQAIEMMKVATQPKFKIGQLAIFQTHQSDLMIYNNCDVTIQRVLTDDECDIDDVGFMYEVITFNGNVFQAFQDELS